MVTLTVMLSSYEVTERVEDQGLWLFEALIELSYVAKYVVVGPFLMAPVRRSNN